MITIQNLSDVSHKCRWVPKEPVIKAGGSVQIEYADFTRWLTQRARVAALMRIDIEKGRFMVVIDNGKTHSAPVSKMDGKRPGPVQARRLSWTDMNIPGCRKWPGYPPLLERSSDAAAPMGMALVVCHYGQDRARLSAEKEALARLLRSDPMPALYVVEAIDPGQPAHFDKIPGAVYLPRTVAPESRGCWMKESLWNIGAKEAAKRYGKLVLLDIDTSFIRKDWAIVVDAALRGNDVVSPHKYSVYLDNEGRPPTDILMSKGACGGKEDRAPMGHPGLGLAFTSSFFLDRLGGQLPIVSCGAGDTNFWALVLGWPRDVYWQKELSKELTPARLRGMRPSPRVGFADNVLFHHYHGPRSMRQYRAKALVSRTCFPLWEEDMATLPDGMPAWPQTAAGRICKAALDDIYKAKEALTQSQARDIYDKHALAEYGPIDAANPLVITCLLRSGGSYDGRHVKLLKKQFDMFCRAPFRFVCQTDIEIPGVETIPLITTREEAPFQWGQIEHYRNIWGNASVLTCDLDTLVVRPFTPHRCPDGEIFMSREFGSWDINARSIWNCGLVYFRGNFEGLFQSYMRDIRHGLDHRPDRTLIGSQENIVAYLREHGKYVSNIDAHFCQRFYIQDQKGQPGEAHIISFPAKPKPWDLSPVPAWFPEGYEVK